MNEKNELINEVLFMGKYLNIGVLADDIDAVFTKEALKGAELGAIAINANIFIFPGMYLDDGKISDAHSNYEYQFNTIFDFANDKKLDIIYVMLGMIGGRVSKQHCIEFLKKYSGIPVVTLYTRTDGYPSIIFDNKYAFIKEIRHIIVDHNSRNIGFVSGPKTNVDAMERLEAYKEVLKEQNIPYNEDYVIYGNFEESTEGAVRDFVVKHPELDAIVFANDRMAYGGYRAFEKLNIRIGQDLLVVSFDNSEFASNMKPPLTTVDANAVELSYSAIIHANDFIRGNLKNNIDIKTHFIHRSSCGCHSFDYLTAAEQIGITDLFVSNICKKHMENIHSFLFGNFVRSNELKETEQNIQLFIRLLKSIYKEQNVELYRRETEEAFFRITDAVLFRYTTSELFTNFLNALEHLMCDNLSDMNFRISIMELFNRFFQSLAVSNWQLANIQKEGMDRTFQLINSLAGNMSRINNGNTINYSSVLVSLSTIGLKTAYLYLYEEPIKHTRNDKFIKPEKIRFCAYSNDEGSFSIPDEKSLVPVSSIYDNNKMPQNRRLTIVFHPLYSGEDLFGIIAYETHSEFFRNIAPVSIQVSVGLKTIILLEQQKNIQKKLQLNLDKLSANNHLLSKLSKTDPLTGLYNRRGFLDSVDMMISSSLNIGSNAVLVYGDLDGLKQINDKYGHDEGDFAIRECAEILREAFRATDVISRFGGDEFVIFAVMKKANFEEVLKDRIARISRAHNEVLQKPYSVSLSTGVAECIIDDNFDINKLMCIADRKLYNEKLERKTARM